MKEHVARPVDRTPPADNEQEILLRAYMLSFPDGTPFIDDGMPDRKDPRWKADAPSD